MSNVSARKRPCKHTVRKRDTKPAEKLCNPAATLILPSLAGIPLVVYPESIKMSQSKVLQRLAKTLVSIGGEDQKWVKGTDVVEIAHSITTGIDNALQVMAGASGEVYIQFRKGCDYTGSNEAIANGHDIINIGVRFVHDGPCPIFYKEVVKAVEAVSHPLSLIVKDALRLLGYYCYSSDDVRTDAVEWFKMMEEDLDDKDMIVEYRKNCKAIKKDGKRGFFQFTDTVNAKLLIKVKKKIENFSPESSDEIQVLCWLNDLVELVSHRHHLTSLNEDSMDECMHYGMMYPVFYSFAEQEILDYYDERMNGDYSSGAVPETPLLFSLDVSSELLENELNCFLADIAYLSLYEKVFKEAPHGNRE